jgi:hypothetical protein
VATAAGARRRACGAGRGAAQNQRRRHAELNGRLRQGKSVPAERWSWCVSKVSNGGRHVGHSRGQRSAR